MYGNKYTALIITIKFVLRSFPARYDAMNDAIIIIPLSDKIAL
jgi:hypothetical protein